jgi:hypothetical protein
MYLFVQSWDIIRGKETEYTDFVLRRYLPGMREIGLDVDGGFHVVVGAGPNISVVTASPDFQNLQAALDTDYFLILTGEFQEFLANYSSRIFKDTKRVKLQTYGLELGTWRLNQHYTLIPGKEKEYADFIGSEYFPVMLKHGIRIKAEWQGLVGSGPFRILLEGVAQNIQDIGRALESDEFGRAKNFLRSSYVRQYSSRILAPTGRIEAALILREMTEAL